MQLFYIAPGNPQNMPLSGNRAVYHTCPCEKTSVVSLQQVRIPHQKPKT
jgi:hypothetical protein